MKKFLFTLTVLMASITTVFADDIGAYVLKAGTKAYPSGAGLVYGTFDRDASKNVSADKWAEYSEETTTSVMSETGFYVAGKPNEGWHWTGVAGTMKDAQGNLVPAADSLGNIKFRFYTNPYIDVATHGEYYDSDAEALANAPEQPDSVVLTLFGRVIPSYGKHMNLLGEVSLDNPVNDFGQEVTLTAYPDTCSTFAYWTKNDPENGEKITENPMKITVTESAIYYAHFENTEAVKFKGDEGYIFWYDENSWKMPGYKDNSDSSVVAYAFSNGNFVDEKAPTGARATYYKTWTEDNYTIMGGYPHILKINGPGLIYSLYKTPSELLTKAYNMTRWTGKDGLDTDFVDCPDGTENYFYLADLETMSWKLCKDKILPAEKMCLVVNSANCSKDFQGAPEVVYWSRAAAEEATMNPNIIRGSCGGNINYILDIETGVLKIEGTGPMSSYSSSSLDGTSVTTAPWREYYQALTSVTISDGVTCIGDAAFYGCSSLTSITIHSSVTSIEDYAFNGCTSLDDVTCLAVVPPTCGSNSFFKYGTLHVLPGCGDAYRAADEWKNFTIVKDAVKDSDTDITALADVVYVNAMEGKIGTQLVLPILMKNSIEAIGFQADLVLPDCVTVAEDEDGLPMVELSTQRTTTTKTNLFDYSYQPDGSLRILCSSTKGYSFTGNDGEVALVTINISEDIEAGDYPIVLKNIVITDAQGADKKKVDLVRSTLTLFDYILGDVNDDNEIDVADLSAISSYILGHPGESFVEMAADVNKDNEIDVADISALAYLILHPETAQKAKARKVAAKKELTENAYNTLYAEMLQAEAGTDVVLPIMMRNSIEATGFQLDLMLPEGVTLKDAALSNARTSSKRTNLFDYARQADGTYRILCNSTKGLSFNGHDGEVMILTLHIDKDAECGAQTIALKDMVLTDATGMLREESSLSESTLWVGNATSILEMASEKSAPTYDLQGRQVSKKQKGVVVRDGKKIMKK